MFKRRTPQVQQPKTDEPDQINTVTRHVLSGGGKWVLVCAVCLLFFMTTSPHEVPSVLLIVGFVTLGVLFYSLLRLIFAFTKLDARLSQGQRRVLLLAGTMLPTILLGMQSLGQLTLRDVLVMSGLFAIGIFYMSNTRK